MGINPQPDAYPDTSRQAIDIEFEAAQLGQIPGEWLGQDDAPILAEAPLVEAPAVIDNPLPSLTEEQLEDPELPRTPDALSGLRGFKQDSDALFRRLEQGDQYARERLLETHSPLAYKLAARYMDRRSNITDSNEDITQVARLGLLRAIDRFDTSKGIAFGTFAIPTILGEIKRHFRDHSWSLHVPRGPQERALAVGKIINEALGSSREPTLEEIAKSLGITEEEALDGRTILSQAYITESLDEPMWQEDGEQDTITIQDSLADPEAEAAYDKQTDHAELMAAIEQLPPELRTVIAAYFWGGLSQTEIGKLTNVSQMQISRQKRAAVKQLAILLGHDQD